MAPHKNYYISVAGIICSGKTIACNLLAKELGFCLFEENVDGNHFLPLFYEDAKRWAFHTQLFYLGEKVGQLKRIKELIKKTSVVQDSPIYQDYLTYAKAQHLLGYISEHEFKLYEKLFKVFHKELPQPDLIIQLDASLPVLRERIQKRYREYEQKIDPEYIKLLSRLQKGWISKNRNLKTLSVNTDKINLASDTVQQKLFIEAVKKFVN